MNIALYIILLLIIALVAYSMITLRKLKKSPSIAGNPKIIHLDESNFSSTTENSIVLVDFWADWCMPCKMIAPILNELADEVNDEFKICKVNVDLQPKLGAMFGVRSIPTLIILKNGTEVKRFVGLKPKDQLLKELKSIK